MGCCPVCELLSEVNQIPNTYSVEFQFLTLVKCLSSCFLMTSVSSVSTSGIAVGLRQPMRQENGLLQWPHLIPGRASSSRPWKAVWGMWAGLDGGWMNHFSPLSPFSGRQGWVLCMAKASTSAPTDATGPQPRRFSRTAMESPTQRQGGRSCGFEAVSCWDCNHRLCVVRVQGTQY